MTHRRADSLFADLYSHFAMWWAQRSDRRLAARRHRFELKVARPGSLVARYRN